MSAPFVYGHDLHSRFAADAEPVVARGDRAVLGGVDALRYQRRPALVHFWNTP